MFLRLLVFIIVVLVARKHSAAQPEEVRRAATADVQPAGEPPTEWVDPATGHRVIRLSREPGSASLYFHQNAYSADGKKLIITTRSGLSAVDLQSREIEPLVQGNVRVLTDGSRPVHVLS